MSSFVNVSESSLHVATHFIDFLPINFTDGPSVKSWKLTQTKKINFQALSKDLNHRSPLKKCIYVQVSLFPFFFLLNFDQFWPR